MAIFTRFTLLLTFLFSIPGYSQTVSCSACSADVLLKEIPALHSSAQKTVVFKCPLKIGNLQTRMKWGVCDAQGKLLIKPLWDSIGNVTNGLAEVFQYIPQRKKAPLKAGLISIQQKNILPLSYRSIRVIAGTYYSVDTGRGFQLWKSSGKGFLSTLPYDSIIKTTSRILLYTEGFCHRLDSTAQKIEQGPYKEWQTNDNNKIYPIFYDTLYIYRNGTSIVTLLADSIGASSQADEIILHRNTSKVSYRLVHMATPSIHEADPIHPMPLSILLDSTLIKIKKKTQADSLVLVNDWYLYRRKNAWGYGDTLGNIGIGAQYEELRYKHNRRLAAKYKGKWGILDDRENIIVQPYYDEVGDFIYTGTWIRQGNKYNFVGLNGKVLNTNWYDNITPTAGNNYLVQLKGKTGLVSQEGREIIGTRYLQLLDFGGNSCLVQTEDGKWFLMNYAEYRISNDPYSNVQYLSKSKVYVLKK